MGVLNVTNSFSGWLTLWLEPLGEDVWLRPGQTFRIRSDYDGDEPDLSVVFWAKAEDRAAGIENVTVLVEQGNCFNVVVTDENGDVVECGHQRPAGR